MLNIIFTDDTMMALQSAGVVTRKREILEKIDKLFSLHADGLELDWIRCHFADLPVRCDRKAIIWFGDNARFIIANW